MMRNDLSILKNLLKSSRTQRVSQSSSGQKSRGNVGIRDIIHGHDRIEDLKVDDCIDSDRNRVFG